METTWIVAADSARARIFEMHGSGKDLKEIEDFANPAARAADRDIDSDARGRFYGKGEREQAHTAEPQVDAVDHATELFSKALNDYLEKAHQAHRYDKLRVIAFPKFLGLMRNQMSKQLRQCVTDEVEKDISWFDKGQIQEYIQNKFH
jgi:protein required for attachment to host cells